jgi:hypothetical protein
VIVASIRQYFREERWYDINRGKWEISGRGGSIDRNRDRDREVDIEEEEEYTGSKYMWLPFVIFLAFVPAQRRFVDKFC